jgi:hypothetical protein
MKKPQPITILMAALAVAVFAVWSPAAHAQVPTISPPGNEFVSAQPDNPSADPPSADMLWQQDISTNTAAYVNQMFPDEPTATSFLADDFTNTQNWSITSIFVPGYSAAANPTLYNANSLNWYIYADDNGTPAGTPPAAGAAPFWSLSLAPTDPQITITNGLDGNPSNTRIDLDTPVILPPGTWWLIFYPDMAFTTGGQYYRHLSDTMNGYPGMFINPGNYFGYGTEWQSAAVLAGSDYDLAFTLEGTPLCPLSIQYKTILSEKLTKDRKWVFTVTGEEDFDLFGLIDFGPFTWHKVKFNARKDRLKIIATVPAGLAPGAYPVSVGECSGEVVVTGSER